MSTKGKSVVKPAVNATSKSKKDELVEDSESENELDSDSENEIYDATGLWQ
mgnify:CR=1 FL=1